MKLTNEERDTIHEGLVFLEERDFPEAAQLLKQLVKDECSTFTPDWAIPPGEHIKEVIEERYSHLHPSTKQNYPELFAESLAEWLEVPERDAELLLEGRLTLDQDLAERLERNLQRPAHYWLELERNYRRSLARLEDSHISKDQTQEMIDEIREAMGLPADYCTSLRGFVGEVCGHLEAVQAERDAAILNAREALAEGDKTVGQLRRVLERIIAIAPGVGS